MTKEEIETHIDEAVSRKLAALGSEFGQQLAEHYVMKSDVEELVQNALKHGGALPASEDAITPEQLSGWISLFETRVMMMNLFILIQNLRQQTKAQTPREVSVRVRLATLEEIVVDAERQFFLQTVDAVRDAVEDPALLSVLSELESLVQGSPEAERTDTKSQPN